MSNRKEELIKHVWGQVSVTKDVQNEDRRLVQRIYTLGKQSTPGVLHENINGEGTLGSDIMFIVSLDYFVPSEFI